MKRGKKAKNGITFVPKQELKPFLDDIKAHMIELHVATMMYETELRELGYSHEEATKKMKNDCLDIKCEIIQEDQWRML